MMAAARSRTDSKPSWPAHCRWAGRLAVALTVATAALASAARPAVAQSEPRARQGEAFTFNLKFLGSIDAGRARLAVSPPTTGPAGLQLNIVGEAEATGLAKAITGLHEDYRLVLDGNTWLPRHMHLVESGNRSRTVDVAINDRRVDIVSKMATGERHWVGNLPSPPVEPIAILLLLRAARLRDGDKLALVVMDGTAFYQGTITVVGREELASELGTMRAIKLVCAGERISENGQKLARPARTATVWVSDNAARLPLRITGETELGMAVFSLTSYEPGRRPLQPPKTLSGLIEQRQLAPSGISRVPSPPAPAPGVPPAQTLPPPAPAYPPPPQPPASAPAYPPAPVTAPPPPAPATPPPPAPATTPPPAPAPPPLPTPASPPPP